MSPIDRAGVEHDDRNAPLRFRPSARRRNRVAVGVVLGAIAVGGNVLAYTSIDRAEPVVQAVVDIPAGAEIRSDQLRVVEVEVADSVNVVPGDRLESLVGTHAKVRIVSGSLVVTEALQTEPLVAPGSAVVAVVVPPGELPVGLRERVPVQLVMPQRDGESPLTVDAVTVALPTDVDSALGERSLSVEVAVADAATVAAADDVRVVLLEPDPAIDPAEAADAGRPAGLASDGGD